MRKTRIFAVLAAMAILLLKVLEISEKALTHWTVLLRMVQFICTRPTRQAQVDG